MPLKTDTPQVVLKVEADTYSIRSYEVDSESLRVVVRVRRGLAQPDGTVTWIDQVDGTLDARAIVSVVPEPGETIYAATKRLLYAEAMAQGLIPTGTVS